MELRFGVIGYGAWGSHHARAIAETPGAKLIGIATPSQESQEKVRKDFPDLPVFGDYRDLIRWGALEAVSIVTPTDLHEEIAVAALEAGKHVLLEKPMALDERGCDRILEAARKSGKTLNIGHEFRFSVQWGAIKAYIDQGRMGDPLYLLINLWRRPYRHGRQGWRRDLHRVGSWIMEEPIHFFDLALWYFQGLGDPRSIYSRANSRVRAEGFYDNFTAVVRWASGAYAVISQTLGGFEHHKTVELVGTKGAVRTWWSGPMDRASEASYGMKRIEGLKGGESFDDCIATQVPLEGKSGEVYELRELIKKVILSIRDGKPCVSGEEGRKAVLLCRQAEKALDAGKEIPLRFSARCRGGIKIHPA